MATQQWTIISLVGAAVPEAERLLARWSAAREPGDHEHWSHDQWPRRERLRAQSLMRQLERHNAMPPVAYFSRHVDLWSSYGDLLSLIPVGDPVICHDEGDIWAYRMPDRGRLARRARKVRLQSVYSESMWLANSLEAAATAYRGLWPQCLILVERRSWKASPTDEELLAASATVPKWLRA